MMRFSIIIPVYNVAPYLRECLDSVLAAVKEVGNNCEMSSEAFNEDCPLSPAHLSSVELICVDDGSTDGSGSILDEYREDVAACDSQAVTHFVVIHQSNQGVSAARNAGLERAVGDWILFVDADDLVDQNWLVEIASLVTGKGEDELVAFDKVEFAGEMQKCELEAQEGQSHSRHIELMHTIPGFMGQLAFCQFAYPRQLLKGLRFQPYTVGEDLLFVATALAEAQSVDFITRPLYAYRRRPGSAMQSAPSPRKLQDAMHYVPEMLQVLSDSGKQIDRIFTHTRANGWLEGVPSRILSKRIGTMGEHTSIDSECAALMREWRESLVRAKSIRCLSRFNRIRAALNRWLPFDFVAILTCVLPNRIKVWRSRHK